MPEHHWSDQRRGVRIELPAGTCILVEPSEDGHMVLVLKPVTDQPSARTELAMVLEGAAKGLIGTRAGWEPSPNSSFWRCPTHGMLFEKERGCSICVER